ncbi:hypothetical protein NLG97_g9304 [Lecanicillium saksenae]|uniref:Uncharacterized protein n=1 Tax=Lecanicillium saksenae TaxID=468837 RepID=A0ACC1QJ46_9HYPO|nr:hypothetical protein NLG97_g9304 [Lecanicillium saksenae]
MPSDIDVSKHGTAGMASGLASSSGQRGKPAGNQGATGGNREQLGGVLPKAGKAGKAGKLGTGHNFTTRIAIDGLPPPPLTPPAKENSSSHTPPHLKLVAQRLHTPELSAPPKRTIQVKDEGEMLRNAPISMPRRPVNHLQGHVTMHPAPCLNPVISDGFFSFLLLAPSIPGTWFLGERTTQLAGSMHWHSHQCHHQSIPGLEWSTSILAGVRRLANGLELFGVPFNESPASRNSPESMVIDTTSAHQASLLNARTSYNFNCMFPVASHRRPADWKIGELHKPILPSRVAENKAAERSAELRWYLTFDPSEAAAQSTQIMSQFTRRQKTKGRQSKTTAYRIVT